MARTYWLETLGCAKNEVDSDKLAALMRADGLCEAADPVSADVVVVNTCAFIEAAREESVATILDLDGQRRRGSELVVTGCMAQRYGGELAEVLPEADRVIGFGVSPVVAAKPQPVPVELGRRGRSSSGAVPLPEFDLLNLPRPASPRPWAYVKAAEGCDKACGFCAIPSFRGPQRSRSIGSIIDEVDRLGVREVVLVAQDLGAYGRDGAKGQRRITELFDTVSDRVDRVRLLYLYPSELTDALIERVAASPVPYFDLSLQHVSAALVRRMRRPGDATAYLERIDRIRSLAPGAATRSNFMVGYPGETEDDHDQLLHFLEAAGLDWCGFFAYSEEEGTHAAELDATVPPGLAQERLAELTELQDRITTSRRDALVGTQVEVLVDEPGVARSYREAPEIDGIIEVPAALEVGELHTVVVTGATGPDLTAAPVDDAQPSGAAQPEGSAEPG